MELIKTDKVELECNLINKKDGYYFCETCEQLGRERDLLNECPHNHWDSYKILEQMQDLWT